MSAALHNASAILVTGDEAAKRAAEGWIEGKKQYRQYAPAFPAVCELTRMRTDCADQMMRWSAHAEQIDGRPFRWIAKNSTEIMP